MLCLVKQVNFFFAPLGTCYSRFAIVPTVMLGNPSTWKNSVTSFCEHYFSDLPNVIGLPAELTLWQRRWEEKVEEVGIDKLPDRGSKTFISVDSVAFQIFLQY